MWYFITNNIASGCFYKVKVLPILEKVKKNIQPKHYADWKKKDIIWFKFFLFAPELCSKLRNFSGIGV